MRAAGRTPQRLETELTERLRAFIHEPQVLVRVTQFRSQPVSVIGAVNKPGIHQLEGHKSLIEILSLAAGPRQDAGHTVKITRRREWGPIPLESAADDPSGRFNIAEVSLEAVMEARNPEENVLIMPNDVISVPRAEMIYVIGGVERSGGFVLHEKENITVLQALALAGGLTRTSAKELGVIPSSTRDAPRPKGYGYFYGSRRRKQLNGESAPSAGNGKPGGAAAESAETVELTSWQRKPTLIAESFRATLTSILFAGENGARPRVLVVTSPSPGEGKTTVASNLAICLAEINRRVLLIDADMRKPRVHKIFDIANRHGLSDLLRESGAIEQRGLSGFVSGTEIPGLSVLPSGSPTHSIPNLLHSVRTPELISCAKEEFDTVLIDTPPMMQISDARVLGQMSDAVILVLRAGQTTRGTAKAAAERFLEDGTRVLGTVLNSWNPKANGYGYYDNYYYEHYYAEKEEQPDAQPS